MKKEHKRHLILSFALLCFVLWDTILKMLLDDLGFFRFLYKVFFPEASYYWLTYGIWSIRLLPLSFIFLCLSIHHFKNDPAPPNKRALLLNGITLFLQLLILIIALYNHNIFS